MDERGQVQIAQLLTGTIMFVMGLLVLMAMWSPLVGNIFPLLANAQTVAYGSVTQLLLQFVPLIFIAVGILGIFSALRPPSPYG